MGGQSSRSRGIAGEELAARYLRRKGYKIVDTGYRTRFGEIDVIARDKKYLVFVEVKLRSLRSQARPAEYVTADKQRRIVSTALLYVQSHPTELQMRFDVIEITASEDMRDVSVNHIENAFSS